MADRSTENDINLFDAIRTDDKEAFRILYERYWKALYVRACKDVDEDEAKDMIQEVMVSFWNRRNSIQIAEAADIGRYLFTAIKYRIISFYTNSSSPIKRADLLDSPDFENPESLLENEELRQGINDAIDTLPEKMKIIFRMSREQDQSIPEISLKLNLSEQTVKNQITHALKRLRDILLDPSVTHKLSFLPLLLMFL
ncbi:sigma-70 family RNA polymerase sigma factor [Dyadobacter sp. 3J3]|uniref:sigma-70 family RNA polymerase sigma factor n=1 Tax=Dyadobacter sp. 3J3 TaxID=2606600 RepID=UPI00135902E7|nr:sigma-70 family RNA polymerase sigma factor [Dyadobacter sp. 3J3]